MNHYSNVRLAAWSFVLALLTLAMPPAPSATAAEGSSRIYKSGITGPEFQKILKALGQTTTLKSDKEGDPELSGTVEGVKYAILFYGCNEAPVRRCLSYQYYAGFNGMSRLSMAQINEWNAQKRFGAASFRNGNVAEIRMTVNIEGGVTADNFRGWLGWWIVAMKQFKEHIGYK